MKRTIWRYFQSLSSPGEGSASARVRALVETLKKQSYKEEVEEREAELENGRPTPPLEDTLSSLLIQCFPPITDPTAFYTSAPSRRREKEKENQNSSSTTPFSSSPSPQWWATIDFIEAAQLLDGKRQWQQRQGGETTQPATLATLSYLLEHLTPQLPRGGWRSSLQWLSLYQTNTKGKEGRGGGGGRRGEGRRLVPPSLSPLATAVLLHHLSKTGTTIGGGGRGGGGTEWITSLALIQHLRQLSEESSITSCYTKGKRDTSKDRELAQLLLPRASYTVIIDLLNRQKWNVALHYYQQLLLFSPSPSPPQADSAKERTKAPVERRQRASTTTTQRKSGVHSLFLTLNDAIQQPSPSSSSSSPPPPPSDQSLLHTDQPVHLGSLYRVSAYLTQGMGAAVTAASITTSMVQRRRIATEILKLIHIWLQLLAVQYQLLWTQTLSSSSSSSSEGGNEERDPSKRTNAVKAKIRELQSHWGTTVSIAMHQVVCTLPVPPHPCREKGKSRNGLSGDRLDQEEEHYQFIVESIQTVLERIRNCGDPSSPKNTKHNHNNAVKPYKIVYLDGHFLGAIQVLSAYETSKATGLTGKRGDSHSLLHYATVHHLFHPFRMIRGLLSQVGGRVTSPHSRHHDPKHHHHHQHSIKDNNNYYYSSSRDNWIQALFIFKEAVEKGESSRVGEEEVMRLSRKEIGTSRRLLLLAANQENIPPILQALQTLGSGHTRKVSSSSLGEQRVTDEPVSEVSPKEAETHLWLNNDDEVEIVCSKLLTRARTERDQCLYFEFCLSILQLHYPFYYQQCFPDPNEKKSENFGESDETTDRSNRRVPSLETVSILLKSNPILSRPSQGNDIRYRLSWESALRMVLCLSPTLQNTSEKDPFDVEAQLSRCMTSLLTDYNHTERNNRRQRNSGDKRIVIDYNDWLYAVNRNNKGNFNSLSQYAQLLECVVEDGDARSRYAVPFNQKFVENKEKRLSGARTETVMNLFQNLAHLLYTQRKVELGNQICLSLLRQLNKGRLETHYNNNNCSLLDRCVNSDMLQYSSLHELTEQILFSTTPTSSQYHSNTLRNTFISLNAKTVFHVLDSAITQCEAVRCPSTTAASAQRDILKQCRRALLLSFLLLYRYTALYQLLCAVSPPPQGTTTPDLQQTWRTLGNVFKDEWWSYLTQYEDTEAATKSSTLQKKNNNNNNNNNRSRTVKQKTPFVIHHSTLQRLLENRTHLRAPSPTSSSFSGRDTNNRIGDALPSWLESMPRSIHIKVLTLLRCMVEVSSNGQGWEGTVQQSIRERDILIGLTDLYLKSLFLWPYQRYVSLLQWGERPLSFRPPLLEVSIYNTLYEGILTVLCLEETSAKENCPPQSTTAASPTVKYRDEHGFNSTEVILSLTSRYWRPNPVTKQHHNKSNTRFFAVLPTTVMLLPNQINRLLPPLPIESEWNSEPHKNDKTIVRRMIVAKCLLCGVVESLLEEEALLSTLNFSHPSPSQRVDSVFLHSLLKLTCRLGEYESSDYFISAFETSCPSASPELESLRQQYKQVTVRPASRGVNPPSDHDTDAEPKDHLLLRIANIVLQWQLKLLSSSETREREQTSPYTSTTFRDFHTTLSLLYRLCAAVGEPVKKKENTNSSSPPTPHWERALYFSSLISSAEKKSSTRKPTTAHQANPRAPPSVHSSLSFRHFLLFEQLFLRGDASATSTLPSAEHPTRESFAITNTINNEEKKKYTAVLQFWGSHFPHELLLHYTPRVPPAFTLQEVWDIISAAEAK